MPRPSLAITRSPKASLVRFFLHLGHTILFGSAWKAAPSGIPIASGNWDMLMKAASQVGVAAIAGA